MKANKIARLDPYPLLRTEDLFAFLAEWRRKNRSHFYQQLLLHKVLRKCSSGIIWGWKDWHGRIPNVWIFSDLGRSGHPFMDSGCDSRRDPKHGTQVM